MHNKLGGGGAFPLSIYLCYAMCNTGLMNIM